MIKTRFFIVSIRQPNVAKTEKERNCAFGFPTDRRAGLLDQYNYQKGVELTGSSFPAARQTGTPRHFLFDKEPIRGRGYQQYEQSAGMDRNTLSLRRNVGR
jgi:hypothetical protein